MVECGKHSMLMEINWRYIMRIVVLVRELWVCMVIVAAFVRSIESILVSIGFMLVNRWRGVPWVVIVLIGLVWGKIVVRNMAVIMFSVVSITFLFSLVVFLDFLWVMCGLMDRFLMMDRLLVGDGEVCSDGCRVMHWLFVDWLDMAHLWFLMNRFVVNRYWLMMDWLMRSHGLGLFLSFTLLFIKLDVVVASNVMMDCHSGDFLNVSVSGIVADGYGYGCGLDASNSLMDRDNWGNRLRKVSVTPMAISYIIIVAVLITRVEMLFEMGIDEVLIIPVVAPALLLDGVIQVSITLKVA